MKRLALIASALALALSSACAQQDPALLVTLKGQFRVPTDADALDLDVLDGATVIKHAHYALTVKTPLPVSVSIVQSGAAHPHVKINAQLTLTGMVVALGTTSADFQSGKTVDVAMTLQTP